MHFPPPPNKTFRGLVSISCRDAITSHSVQELFVSCPDLHLFSSIDPHSSLKPISLSLSLSADRTMPLSEDGGQIRPLVKTDEHWHTRESSNRNEPPSRPASFLAVIASSLAPTSRFYEP